MFVLVLIQLFRWDNSVDAELLERFYIEGNLHPPIFGSFAYDPVKQDFDLHERVVDTTPESQKMDNGSYFSTALIQVETKNPGVFVPPKKVMLRQNSHHEAKAPKKPNLKSKISIKHPSLIKPIEMVTSKSDVKATDERKFMNAIDNVNLIHGANENLTSSDTTSQEMLLSKQTRNHRLKESNLEKKGH